MFRIKSAMRYYRLWIYTCNAVLLFSVMVFLGTAFYVIADSRRQLISSVQLYQPSFLYAYLALFMQSGVVQAIGCFGALRLDERLLKTYWLLLLGLLVGDVVVGGYWMVRYERLSSTLGRDMLTKFNAEYVDSRSDFHQHFDELQRDSFCCGVSGPQDYNTSWWQSKMYGMLDRTDEEKAEFRKHEDLLLPWACCVPNHRNLRMQPALANTIRGRLLAKSQDEGEEEEEEEEARQEMIHADLIPVLTTAAPRLHEYSPEIMIAEGPIMEPFIWCRFSTSHRAKWHHHQGCHKPFKYWLDTSADALFVIGFCVIGFLKFTFLGLLRFEIKEMIQKIKLLQNENHQLNGELGLLDMADLPSSLDATGLDEPVLSIGGSFPSPERPLSPPTGIVLPCQTESLVATANHIDASIGKALVGATQPTAPTPHLMGASHNHVGFAPSAIKTNGPPLSSIVVATNPMHSLDEHLELSDVSHPSRPNFITVAIPGRGSAVQTAI
eukprot:maker-scaffold1067_size65077-snap-gene-0.7 protein:Tk10144 transcript:maker-scaffold1067_size65077-snap-gene-0.7-mRNA-1 annotation:"PREDICTED: uncharacterized protein LOC100569714"